MRASGVGEGIECHPPKATGSNGQNLESQPESLPLGDTDLVERSLG